MLPILLATLLLHTPRVPQAPPADPPAASSLEAEVQQAIDRGRALLAAGKAMEALDEFARAAELDGHSLRTRTWVLRARLDLGESDEVLAALDELERAGERGIEMSYLYGMAFALRAEAAVASGKTDSSTGALFLDSLPLLGQAIEADAQRFVDATLVLARAAWQAQELEIARRAAEQAVAARPEWAEAWLQRGRGAMSEFVVAEGEESGSERSTKLWDDATGSYRRALALFEAALDAPRSAEAATALAYALLWRRHAVEATEAFATSIGWAPETHDFAETQRLLAGVEPAQEAEPAPEDDNPHGFRAALTAGRERFQARVGDADPHLATLDWWLGWTCFLDAQWAAAETAFQACLARAPEITSAWYYVGLARNYRKDFEGALAAVRSGCEADRATQVAMLAASGGSVRGFEGLIGWCATQERARNLDAAFLAALLTEAFPEEPRHWNNLGLFLRDEGERLEIEAHRAKLPPPDEELLADLYERSYAAYQHTLALTPDDPQVINDTALMLQYHLGRDLDQVEAMYRRSIALSEERLADPHLSPEDRERFETTRRDATGNLKLLLEPRDPAVTGHASNGS